MINIIGVRAIRPPCKYFELSLLQDLFQLVYQARVHLEERGDDFFDFLAGQRISVQPRFFCVSEKFRVLESIDECFAQDSAHGLWVFPVRVRRVWLSRQDHGRRISEAACYFRWEQNRWHWQLFGNSGWGLGLTCKTTETLPESSP